MISRVRTPKSLQSESHVVHVNIDDDAFPLIYTDGEPGIVYNGTFLLLRRILPRDKVRNLHVFYRHGTGYRVQPQVDRPHIASGSSGDEKDGPVAVPSSRPPPLPKSETRLLSLRSASQTERKSIPRIDHASTQPPVRGRNENKPAPDREHIGPVVSTDNGDASIRVARGSREFK
jgi:hypothetical protein